MRTAPLAALVALLLIAPTAMAAWGMPEAVNDRLEIIESIYTQILFVGTLVFLFVFAWMGYNLVKFRPGGEGQATNEEHRGSVKAELVWTLIPLLIVGWVGVISYQGISDLQANAEEPTTEINVVGFQWFWQFDYGDGVQLSQQPAADGSLANAEPFLIPANEPVRFNITAGDVIHSFYLPELGAKIDAIPGTDTYTTVTAPEGEYMIQCAEMCGLNHAYMNAKIKAVPMEDYEAWLDEKRAEAATGGLEQALDVNLTDDGIEPAEMRTVAGVKTVFQVDNQASDERDLTLEATENTTGPIASGENATFNVTLDAGEYTLTSGDDTATLTVVHAETIDVTLTDFDIEASTTTLEVGQSYLINVVNDGGTVHNLFIGAPEESAGSDEILWETTDLNPGESETILVTPTEDETGSWEWWCDVSGHYQLGMTIDGSVE